MRYYQPTAKIFATQNAQTRSYQYNEDQKTYFRFMNNAPHNDKVTGNN